MGSNIGATKGKRIKRGLYKTATYKLINADINGSMNIARKVIPNTFVRPLGRRRARE